MNPESARFLPRELRRRHLRRVEFFPGILRYDLDLFMICLDPNSHFAGFPLISMADDVGQSLIDAKKDLFRGLLLPAFLPKNASKFLAKRRKNLG